MNELFQADNHNESQEVEQTNLIIINNIDQESANQQQLTYINNSSPDNKELQTTQELPQFLIQESASIPQRQQTIHVPSYQNNIDPDMLINTINDGSNRGQIKRFGLLITSMWAIQLVVNYIYVFMVFTYKIDFKKEMFIIYIILYIGILLTSVLIKVPSLIQIFLFIAHIISSCYYQVAFVILYYQIFLEKQLDKVFIFDVCKLCVIVAAFLCLLIIKKTPNTLVVSIISLILYALVINYVNEIAKLEYQFIPVIFCCLQSCMLVFPLQKVYNGKYKAIKTDRILLGFLQFKVYFYIPCI